MFSTYDLSVIALGKYLEKSRQTESHTVDGVTLWEPTLLDRAIWALKAKLGKLANITRRSGIQLTPNRANVG